MEIAWFFLPFIITLGIITSYEDVKKGKIRNIWVLTAIAASLAINLLLLIFGAINMGYLAKLGIISLLSLMIGFFVWFFGYWSAGDAKLFFAFTMLIPLTSYKAQSGAAIYLIANTFMPLFVYFIITILIRTGLKQKISIIKEAFNWKKVVDYMLTVFGIGWIFALAVSNIKMNIYPNFPQNIFTGMIGILMISLLLRKISDVWLFRKNGITYMKIVSVLCILRLIFSLEQMLLLSFWQNYLLTTIAYMAFFMLMNELGGLFVNHVDIPLLKAGMVPAEAIMKEKNAYVKTKVMSYNMGIGDNKNLLFMPGNDGLTDKDVAAIKSLFRRKKLKFDHLAVQQTVPFAPFLFLGCIITIALKCDLISFFIGLI